MPDTALTRATQLYLDAGADPATAEQCGREMVNFLRALEREAQRQAQEDAAQAAKNTGT